MPSDVNDRIVPPEILSKSSSKTISYSHFAEPPNVGDHSTMPRNVRLSAS